MVPRASRTEHPVGVLMRLVHGLTSLESGLHVHRMCHHLAQWLLPVGRHHHANLAVCQTVDVPVLHCGLVHHATRGGGQTHKLRVMVIYGSAPLF